VEFAEPRLVRLLGVAPVLPGGSGSCKVGDVVGDPTVFSLFMRGVLATLPAGDGVLTRRADSGIEDEDLVRSRMLVRENLKADKSAGGTQLFSFS
jgi:hypothetical protein